MVATTDPLVELRRWCDAEVEILDRALAAVRGAFARVDELLAEEQGRDAGEPPIGALKSRGPERVVMKLPVPPHPDAFMHTTLYGTIGIALVVFGGAVLVRDGKQSPEK